MSGAELSARAAASRSFSSGIDRSRDALADERQQQQVLVFFILLAPRPFALRHLFGGFGLAAPHFRQRPLGGVAIDQLVVDRLVNPGGKLLDQLAGLSPEELEQKFLAEEREGMPREGTA